jgi:hypothetical protein
MTGAAFAKIAPNNEGACPAREATKGSVMMLSDFIPVHVYVFYSSHDDDGNETQRPAGGVHIFNAETNELFGKTNDDGRLDLVVKPGTRIRAIEPVYGEQQYEGTPIYNEKGEIIGWKA